MSSVWVEKKPSAKKKWMLRYRDELGKKRTAESFASKTQAQMEANVLRQKMQLQPKYATDIMSMVAVIESYIKNRKASGHLSDGQACSTRDTVNLAVNRMGWDLVSDVTPASIDQWQATYKTIGAWRVLRSVLRYARIELEQPVSEKALFRKQKRSGTARIEPDLMSDDLVDEALCNARTQGPHAEALIHWLATYGCRPITLLHMQVGDIDLHNSAVHIRHNKNRMEYQHAITTKTKELIAAIHQDRPAGERLFFDPRTEQPWAMTDRQTASRISEWYRINISKGFPKSYTGIYALKDWCITRLVESGMPDHQIILFTGHQNTISLQKYKKSNLSKTRELLDKLPAI